MRKEVIKIRILWRTVMPWAS